MLWRLSDQQLPEAKLFGNIEGTCWHEIYLKSMRIYTAAFYNAFSTHINKRYNFLMRYTKIAFFAVLSICARTVRDIEITSRTAIRKVGMGFSNDIKTSPLTLPLPSFPHLGLKTWTNRNKSDFKVSNDNTAVNFNQIEIDEYVYAIYNVFTSPLAMFQTAVSP